MIGCHIDATSPNDHGLWFTHVGDLINEPRSLECQAESRTARLPSRARHRLRSPSGEAWPAGVGTRRRRRRVPLVTNVDRPTPVRGGAARSDRVRAQDDAFRRTQVRRPSSACAAGWHAVRARPQPAYICHCVQHARGSLHMGYTLATRSAHLASGLR